MTTRRHLFALPLLALPLPNPAWARHPAWAHDVSEVRVAGADPGGVARHLGVPVRGVAARGPALLEALDRGHIEAALLDPVTLHRARARMGARLAAYPAAAGRLAAVRTALPPAMQRDLVAALLAGPVPA